MIERIGSQLVLFFVVVFAGCSGKIEKNTTYFGGKIINPKSKFVILYGNEVALDTFFLEEDNSFLGTLESINEGLYYFKHGSEHQYVYIEPKDSILIRLNTWDFDESLVFSGKGAERNNFLIDCFLESERDDKFFYQYYTKSPDEFRLKVDSLERLRLKKLEYFFTKYPEESTLYRKILKIALTYPLYAKVESYPLAHNAIKKQGNAPHIDPSFYKHREMIDLRSDSIMYFYAYRDLKMSHLYNKVISEGHKLDSDEFTVSLLKTIAAEMRNEKTKNVILKQTFVGHFYRRSSCNLNRKAFESFLELSTNEDDKRQIQLLLNDAKKFYKGKRIENFHVKDYNKTDKSPASLIKGRNSVVYFWNSEYISKEYIASRINFLSKKHPNINFLGVKIDGNGKDRIKKIDIKSQYYIHSKSEANKFLTSKMPRTLLINGKGIVMNGYASLMSKNIFDQIAQLDNN